MDSALEAKPMEMIKMLFGLIIWNGFDSVGPDEVNQVLRFFNLEMCVLITCLSQLTNVSQKTARDWILVVVNVALSLTGHLFIHGHILATPRVNYYYALYLELPFQKLKLVQNAGAQPMTGTPQHTHYNSDPLATPAVSVLSCGIQDAD